MEPFLKAVGGKRWLAAQLVSEIEQMNPALYVEPFVGGGAVALALPPSIPKIVADMNAAYITVWQALKQCPPDVVLATLRATEKRFPNTAFGYAQARDALNTIRGAVTEQHLLELAALVLYINVRCFNGLWRVNAQGGFNVPWGQKATVRRLELSELIAYQQALITTTPIISDFRATLDGLIKLPKAQRSRIAIYADPPYDGTFAGYTEGGFDALDQRDLAHWLKYLAGLGMWVWSTNTDTPAVRELYSWAHIEAISERHNVGSKADRRGPRACLMIRSR